MYIIIIILITIITIIMIIVIIVYSIVYEETPPWLTKKGAKMHFAEALASAVIWESRFLETDSPAGAKLASPGAG